MNTEMKDESITLKVDVTLTREQVRNYLGSQIVEKDNEPDKITVTVIRDLIKAAVQGHVLSATVDWDLLATDAQISTVDAAVSRLMPDTK